MRTANWDCNEKGCGQRKPPNFKNKLVDEAFSNRTSVATLACGRISAARLFIIAAQNKFLYTTLFILPSSFLSLTPARNCVKDVGSNASS